MLRFFTSLILITLFVSACAHKPTRPTLEQRALFIKDLHAREKFIQIRKKHGSDDSYKELSRLMVELAKEYPNEVVIQASNAAVMGDYGHELPLAEEKKLKAKAVQILEPLTHLTFTNPMGYDRILVFNEYYFHSGNYLKQFELGQELLAAKGPGEYSTGVGGAMYARQLLEQGKKAEAVEFAKKAKAAWEAQAFNYKPAKPEALEDNSFYVLALGISGEVDRAQKMFDRMMIKDKMCKKEPRWCDRINPKGFKKLL